MFEKLEAQFGSGRLSLVELAGKVTVIRLAPLETPSLALEDLDLLMSILHSEVAMFETSLGMREKFNEQIQNRDNFLLVIDPLHPSVGAFQ